MIPTRLAFSSTDTRASFGPSAEEFSETTRKRTICCRMCSSWSVGELRPLLLRQVVCGLCGCRCVTSARFQDDATLHGGISIPIGTSLEIQSLPVALPYRRMMRALRRALGGPHLRRLSKNCPRNSGRRLTFVSLRDTRLKRLPYG